jgi:hypothetical protein
MSLPRYGEAIATKPAPDGTGKIGIIQVHEVNAKGVDLSRFAYPIKSGRHNINRRDW